MSFLFIGILPTYTGVKEHSTHAHMKIQTKIHMIVSLQREPRHEHIIYFICIQFLRGQRPKCLMRHIFSLQPWILQDILRVLLHHPGKLFMWVPHQPTSLVSINI
jgi:hypothetical protein